MELKHQHGVVPILPDSTRLEDWYLSQRNQKEPEHIGPE